MFKINNGTEFVDIESIKKYNGSAWVDCESAKRWDGSAWVEVWSALAGDRLFTSSGTISASFKLEERDKERLAVIETNTVTLPAIPNDLGGIKKRLFICVGTGTNKNIYENGLKSKAVINTSRTFSNTPLAAGGTEGIFMVYFTTVGFTTLNPDNYATISQGGDKPSYNVLYGLDGISDGTFILSYSDEEGASSFADIIDVLSTPTISNNFNTSNNDVRIAGCVSRWFMGDKSNAKIYEISKPVSYPIVKINTVSTTSIITRMGGVK